MPGHISIHAPRGGSDRGNSLLPFILDGFQSTLPAGGATPLVVLMIPLLRFQSTLPVGGATALFSPKPAKTVISIHAPRGGSDQAEWHQAHIGCYFNPRSPWGERLPIDQLLALKKIISIHAPRGGSDQAAYNRRHRTWYFNPRSPWGERPLLLPFFSVKLVFQSTLPVGGATPGHCLLLRPECDFNPRSPWGERLLGTAGALR